MTPRQINLHVSAYHFHRDSFGTPYVHKLEPRVSLNPLRTRCDLLPESMRQNGGELLCDWGQHASESAVRLIAVSVLADAVCDADFSAERFSEELAKTFRLMPFEGESVTVEWARAFVGARKMRRW